LHEGLNRDARGLELSRIETRGSEGAKKNEKRGVIGRYNGREGM